MICIKTVKMYCKDFEKIENYKKAIADESQIWECHHLIEFMPFSGKQVSIKYLMEQCLYYNQKPEAFIFLTKAEHRKLHCKGKARKPFSEGWKRKMSEAHKGKASPNKGKTWKLVDGKRVWIDK